MTPTVTLAELRSLGACAEGLADFERIFPSGGAPLDAAVAALPAHVVWYAVKTRRPDVLATLVGDPSWLVRWWVAWSTATPPDVLEALMSDPDPDVACRASLTLEAL
jgi:hypothetical protein